MSDEQVAIKKRAKNGPGDEEEEEGDDESPDSEREGDDDEDDDEKEKPGDDDDAPDTADEFRHLYKDAKEAEQRLRGLADASEKAGDATTATIYREIVGNVLSLLADVTATAGHAIVEIEEKTDALEDAQDESFLTTEDAERYQAHFEASLKIVNDILEATPASATEQRDALNRFKKATDELIAYTKSIEEG